MDKDKQKQIEELENLLCNSATEHFCDYYSCNSCISKKFARAIYNAGYRKKEQGGAFAKKFGVEAAE